MAEKPNQNWEQRVVDSRGPKFRLDVNNPQMGADGANVYFRKGKAKIEIAVAKGKKQYDKRATKKDRDWNRDKARYIRKSS